MVKDSVTENHLLQQCVKHLINVCQHADEDCPSEYRTKWFNASLKDAYTFVEDLENRHTRT